MLLVRFNIAVWPIENCRWALSSASLSVTLLVSRSGVCRSKKRRPVVEVGGVATAGEEGGTKREFGPVGARRRRGSADEVDSSWEV